MKIFARFLALALLMVASLAAQAQTTVVKSLITVGPSTWIDLLNGPNEVMALGGSVIVYQNSSNGVGSTSGSSTTLTLTATPTYPPCIGCVISGTGITAGTTVAAFNGTTAVTLSAAMTVAASTPLTWGVACPASTAAPPTPDIVSFSPALNLQPQMRNVPLYTTARICAYGAQSGGTILTFPLGAW